MQLPTLTSPTRGSGPTYVLSIIRIRNISLLYYVKMGEMKAVSYNMLYEIDDLRNMKRGGRSTEGLLGNIVLRD